MDRSPVFDEACRGGEAGAQINARCMREAGGVRPTLRRVFECKKLGNR